MTALNRLIDSVMFTLHSGACDTSIDCSEQADRNYRVHIRLWGLREYECVVDCAQFKRSLSDAQIDAKDCIKQWVLAL